MYSLRRRLLISAALLLLLFLSLMALALNSAFKKSVLSNAEDGLRNEVLLLIANIDVIDGQIQAPVAFSDPRLSQMDSSLFAQIIDAENKLVWRSPSLLDKQLPVMDDALGEFTFYEKNQWQGNPPIYSMTLGLEWETEQGDIPFTVQVSEHSAAYLKRLARFQRTFGLGLLALGAVLLVLLLSLLGWALKPLNKVTKQVSEIEAGQRQRFDEDYPREVSRLTQNLNQLLSFEEQRINRQKEVLGNLAHSLKTPIAVMKGFNFSDENKIEANIQLDSMQNIIEYQLQSASTIGRKRFNKPIEIRPSTDQIINSLNKLYKDKGINVSLECDQSTVFYGDQGDWMELAGNLLENAFKWTNQTVKVVIKNVNDADQAGQASRAAISLCVEDDGQGIKDDLKQQILQRGVRLDSQTPGHGIGMHIVKGIVEAYDGSISIEDAKPSGVRFSVLLK